MLHHPCTWLKVGIPPNVFQVKNEVGRWIGIGIGGDHSDVVIQKGKRSPMMRGGVQLLLLGDCPRNASYNGP